MEVTMTRTLILFATSACVALTGCGAPGEADNLGEETAAITITDHPVVTVGSNANGTSTGFSAGVFGSISPTSTSNGHRYAAFYDHDANVREGGGWVASVFSVSGFASDPGKAWLTSVQVPNQPVHTTTNTTYSFISGTAMWTWNSPGPFGFGYLPTPTCTIVHQ
jgi:hypothetical protein